MIKEILKELFEGAKIGRVILESDNSSWIYRTKFLINESNGEDISIKIADYDLLVDLINEYLDLAYNFYYDDKNYYELNEKGYIKKLIFDLFINLDNYDCYDIYSYINKKIATLKDLSVNVGEFYIGKYLDYTIKAKIKKNRSNLEAPYQFIITIKDNLGNVFELPQITFAIANKIAYLMCVQNKNKEDNKLINKLDRYFRKVNKGVNPDEDISKISPRALISLTIFNSYLKSKGITQVEAPSYLPIRYSSKVLKATSKNINVENELDDIDRDQYNMTNRLMYLFQRYTHHFKECDSEFDSLRQRMQLFLKETKTKGDNIIFDIDSLIVKRSIKHI